LIVIDRDTCIVDTARYFLSFTQSESCGKCVPCREGNFWLLKILERIVHGHGREGDIVLILDLCGNIGGGKTLCALGDAAINPVLGGLRLFRDEFEYHIRHGHCAVQGA